MNFNVSCLAKSLDRFTVNQDSVLAELLEAVHLGSREQGVSIHAKSASANAKTVNDIKSNGFRRSNISAPRLNLLRVSPSEFK